MVSRLTTKDKRGLSRIIYDILHAQQNMSEVYPSSDAVLDVGLEEVK